MNIKVFKFYHLPFRSPHFNKNVHVPFYIGDPKKNIGNYFQFMDINYKNNIHDLNPKLNEFTGIYCVLNNFEAICNDLKIDPNKIDFFGFEHYSRTFDINAVRELKDNSILISDNYHRADKFARRYRPISKYLIPFFKEFDIQNNNGVFLECFVINMKYMSIIRSYMNKIYELIMTLLNNNPEEYLYYTKKIYPTGYFGVCNSRTFGFLIEIFIARVMQHLIEKYNLNVHINHMWRRRDEILFVRNI